MYSSFIRISATCLLLVSLASNVLLMISGPFHGFLAEFLDGVVPNAILDSSIVRRQTRLEAENRRLEHLRRVQGQSVRVATKRIAARSARTVALNVGSVFTEAVPFIGIGVMLAVTAADVHAACETTTELDQLLRDLDLAESVDEKHTICGVELPSIKEIKAHVTSTTE